MLKESNVRKGFVVHDQYSRLRDALPDYLKPVLAMGYYTGMRQGEILPLRWEQVSFRDSQVLLDPGTTKNDEPRIVPLTGELRAIFEMQFDRHKLECPQCPFVFFYRGRKIGVFRKVWRNPCVRLGLARVVCVHCGKSTVGTEQCAPCSKLGKQNQRRYEGLLFHDLRRTAVRNLVRAGVPERVAMDGCLRPQD
jgi:integrase